MEKKIAEQERQKRLEAQRIKVNTTTLTHS